MVFYGGFSKGCITCLKRRVKCDEGKPSCARCAKSKRDCLGYRDEQSLAFRDEGRAAAGNLPRWKNKIRIQNANDDRTYGIRRFTDAVLDTSIHSDAALCGLPTVAIVQALRAQPGSSLYRAKEALNTAMMAARDPYNHCLKESSHISYGRAISALASDTRLGFDTNDLIICILLLVIAGTTMESGPNLRWWAMHSSASEAIVRQRGRDMGNCRQSIQLLLCIRSQMLLRYSTRPEEWTDIIDDDDPNLLSWSDLPREFLDNPACALQRILTPLPDIRWDYEVFMDQDYDSIDMLLGLDLIERCRRVDQALAHWHELLPPDWQAIHVDHKPATMPEDPDLNFIMSWAAGEKICVYRDQWVLFHQSTFMIYRFFLQGFILGVGSRLLGCSIHDIAADKYIKTEPLYTTLTQAKQTLLGLVDRSCRSVYHHIGLSPPQLATNPIKTAADLRPPVFAHIILTRILWLANSVIIADNRHKKMIKASLRTVGNHFGMKFCLHLGNDEDWCLTPLFSTDPANYTAYQRR